MLRLVFYLAFVFLALAMTPPEGFGPETVINFSGYEVVNNTRHLFYWFFESRGSPSTDPFILWMTGGPGCSGMLALITENGPYKLAADGKTLSLNPYSWNSHANVMWIDQPVGAGYSYDDSLVDIGVVTEEQMADNMFEFLQKWFTKYTKYSKLPFYIAAESYGGHYGPALSSYILKHNSDKFFIPLKGLMIGNGLVVPEVQYAYYAKYAIDHKVVKPAEYDVMMAALPACLALIHNCAVNSTLGWLVCFNAYDVCNMAELIPVTLGGINPYDVRLPCEVQPLCYNFSSETAFFGSEETKKALGVPSTVSWKMCNRVTDLKLVLAGDWMLSYGQDIPILLSKGVGVLVYHGDQDFICNWYGGIHWTKNLDWEGKSAFNSAPNTTWTVMDKDAGSYISALNFTFLRVYDAGHMVPHDKPAAALQMISDFMAGKFP